MTLGRLLDNQRGETKYTTIFLVLAVAIGAYVVIRLAPPYIRDFQLQSTVEMAAKLAADPDPAKGVDIYLARKVYEMDLPIGVEDFVIERTHEEVRVYIDWEYEVAFVPKNPVIPAYIKVLKFHEEAVEPVYRK